MKSSFCADRRSVLVAGAAALLAPAVFGVRQAWAANEAVVEVENGKLRGSQANGAMSFKGIPYAADTGGANRFMAPRPVVNWKGVRDALNYGDRCPQLKASEEGLRTTGTDWFAWYRREATYSENCCVLNVYTRDLDRNARRPVMLYIHGGGFRSGGGDAPALDGSELAKFGDVVVVTVNHRLNLLGYLQLSHLDEDFADAANAGQLDLIAALRWVKNNISAFGGDPGRVLLFGQSGGGSKIATLMIMPGAKGLLHRAVNMSGTTAYSMGPASAREPLTDEFIRTLGLGKRDVRKLQELPPAQLLAAYQAAVKKLNTDDYRPVVDGRHIPFGPLTPEGLAVHASIPMIMGTTETESTFWLARDPRNLAITEDQLGARIKAQFKLGDAEAAALIAGYRKEYPARTPWDVLAALVTDLQFRGRMLVGAEAKANTRTAPVYLYNFVWKVPVDAGIWASPHTVDIPFAFGNVETARMMTGPGPGPIKVSHNLMSAFVGFARTGDPGNPRMPEWKRYESTTRQTMAVDDPCRLISDFHGAGRIASAPLLYQQAFQIQRGPLFGTS